MLEICVGPDQALSGLKFVKLEVGFGPKLLAWFELYLVLNGKMKKEKRLKGV